MNRLAGGALFAVAQLVAMAASAVASATDGEWTAVVAASAIVLALAGQRVWLR